MCICTYRILGFLGGLRFAKSRYMNNPSRPQAPGTRIQTTVSVLSETIDTLDKLAEESGVSRSRLIDLAVRRFVRWAVTLQPNDLRLIADYEVDQPISGFMRRPTPPPDESSGGPAPAQTSSGNTPRPRQRNDRGRYVTETPPPVTEGPSKRGSVPTT